MTIQQLQPKPRNRKSKFSKHSAYIKANSLKINYIELADSIGVTSEQLYRYLKRNKIPWLRLDGSKSTEKHNMSAIKLASKGKCPVVKIDRAAFTKYSNQQYAY